MSIRSRRGVLVALCLFALFALASPALSDHLMLWGNEVQVSTKVCPSFCTSSQFQTDGGVNVLSAFASISDSRGNAQASSELSSASGITTPLLKAEAFSTGPAPTDNSAEALAYGVEGYTYVGTATKVLMVDVTLTGDVFDPNDESANDIDARVLACGESGFAFSPFAQCDFGEEPPFSDVLDSLSLTIEQTETGAVRTGTLVFSVLPGDSFYLRAKLDATARRDGSSADAFSTLTMSFQDNSDLVTASSGDPHVTPFVPALPAGWIAIAFLALLGAAYAIGRPTTRRLAS